MAVPPVGYLGKKKSTSKQTDPKLRAKAISNRMALLKNRQVNEDDSTIAAQKETYK